MDNVWQIKCSSAWASSSQMPQQESRNQMERSTGQYFHPYVTQQIGSMASGMGREPTVFNTLHLGSSKSGKPELRNSFLDLLSGSSLQVQLSNSTSGKLPMLDSSHIIRSDNCEVPLVPVGLLSQHQENKTVANGAERHPVNSSREASAHIDNYVSVFCDNYQTENLNRYSSDIAMPNYHHAMHGNESGTSPSASRWGRLASSKPPTLGQCNAKNVQASVKVSSDIKSLASDCSSASISGHPFVFCLDTKGELLLSNTGFLGVLCSCHGLHMSIRKFCEHSGLSVVNPGEAVCLESGETIAQWRRFYFLKSGIRIPDDNSGWEWPERIPATVGLVKCKTTGPNMPKNSDMFQMVDPFVGLTGSGQSCNNLTSQNISQTGQSILEKTFNNVMQQQRNTQEGCSVFHRSLIGNTQSTLPSPSDIHMRQIIKENPDSGGLPPSKSPLEKGQEDNAYQSISDYINFLTKDGGAFISNQNLGNFKFLGTDSNVNRSNSMREAFITDRDAIPSNIELRLGQPSQQSHTLEGSVVSAVPSRIHDYEKSLSQASIFRAGISRVAGESRQNLWYAPSDNSGRQNQSQLNLMHLIPGSSNAVDAAKLELLNGDTAKSSLVSMFLSHLNTPSERELQPHADSNMISGEPVMLRVPHYESHIAHDSSDIPKNRSDERQGQRNINRLGPLNNTDRDQGLHCADNRSYTTEKANPLFHNKHIAGLNPFTGVAGGNHLLGSLNVNENHSPYLCQSSGILQDPSDIVNLSNQFGKGSFPGVSSHLDQILPRSMNFSAVTDGPHLPMSAVSMGFSSTTSVCRQNLTPPLANRDGDASPHMVDENLRLLALRRMLDFSKQEHIGAFYEMEHGQERVCSLSAMETQRQGSTLCPLSSSEEIKDGTHFITKQDAPEVSVKHLLASSSRFRDSGMEKLADGMGVNNWCNYTTSSQPISLRSMEPDIQYLPSFGPICYKQPMLRFGRIETSKCTILDHEACSQTEPNPNLPERYSCAFQSVSLSESCTCGGKASMDGCKGNIGRGNITAPTLVPSIFDNVHMNLKDKANAIGRYDNLKRQSSTQNDCQTSQWRDVPSKQKGCCNAPCIERPAEVFNGRRNVKGQPIETAAVVINEIQEAESLNEQQMSNGFSGCSAPAITEVTGEVNNVGSCTMDARYVNDHVFDEGSGIAKCWSSDETFDNERSTETVNGSGKLDMAKRGFSYGLPALSSEGPIDDLRSGNIRLKKLPNRSPDACTVYKSFNCKQKLESDFKVGKQKKPTKWKRLDATFPATGLSSVHYDSPNSQGQDEIHLSSSCGTKVSSRSNHGLQIMCGISSNGHSNFKRKRSALKSAKTLSKKRDRHGIHEHHGDWEDYSRKKLKDEMLCSRNPKLLGENRSKWCCNTDANRHFPRRETNQVSARKAVKDDSAGSVQHSNFFINHIGMCDRQPRPVVCGNSGIISNGKLTSGQTKPTKIVPLNLILKKARRCVVSENEEPIPVSVSETKKSCFRSEYNNIVFKRDVDTETFLFEKKKEGFSRNEVCLAELSMPQKDRDSGCPRSLNQDILKRFSSAPLKSKFKEARKRSLDELSGKGNKLSPAKNFLRKSLRCSFRTKHRFHEHSCLLKGTDDNQCHAEELCEGISRKSIKDRKCQAFIVDSDAFCCVCGSSNEDEINCLLECSVCSIRVHQACYGVSKAPKGRWYCRPCSSNSKNIVCVLCGYGGGAMTRALKSHNIVKSFLKAWDITEHSSSAVLKKNWHKQTNVMKNSSGLARSEVHNSIIAGALDPIIKQWVHMVCGLWTPGTRCPNVDTMSAFDVSGASRPPKDVVCSMCNQFGGSYIQCRVLNCTVHFHPWCAHQKGLLQSEVEGVDNEKVGFYGRCLLHVTHSECDSDNDLVDTKFDVKKEEFSCARTQSYKGRRKDGCRHFHYVRSNSNDGCLVPQEQINAWLHINGQKSSARGLLKPQGSDIEYDCRKEYARYKQVKGWKHLVVYKSGIHALGLYTSRFIPRRAMVVEYVGEIVGLRVADKREIEYQSGRKLQYKSACYFFRIDKEHIIDATRNGGIARFVNHSCLPNCVAKVISVRNEKKVVFFAERDINPGEEITYDYHFNHEDEGKKIPCFCNSKNCRRYLN